MATNKELNEKIDKLTDMFNAMMAIQAASSEGKIGVLQPSKKRGRPAKQTIVESVKKRRGSGWANNFIDDGKEHIEDREIDKKLSVTAPVDKGERKPTTVKSVCSTCEKQESVPKQFVFEGHHTCQKCLKSKIGK